MPTAAPLPQRFPGREKRAWTEVDRLLKKDEAETRVSVASALLLTVLFHGVVFLALPWQRKEKPETPATAPVEYTLEPISEEDWKFVEVNPDANQDKPDPTDNFSSANARAAQEEPDPESNADTPRVENPEPVDSQKIVEGDLREPTPPAGGAPSQPQPAVQPMPPTPPSPPVQPPEPTPPQPAAVTPPPEPATAPPAQPDGIQGTPPAEATGEGIRVVENPPENPAPETPPAQEPAEAPPTVAASQPTPPTPATPAVSPGEVTPMPRPVLQKHIPPGPVMSRPTSARDVGMLQVSSNFNEFGVYLEKMIEAIVMQWNLLGDNFTFGTQDFNSQVVVLFSLNSQGEVVDLQIQHYSSSRGAMLLCVNAVRSRSPFGPWTQEMMARLGQQQDVRITFYYR